LVAAERIEGWRRFLVGSEGQNIVVAPLSLQPLQAAVDVLRFEGIGDRLATSIAGESMEG
jgi:hypothetical protein